MFDVVELVAGVDIDRFVIDVKFKLFVLMLLLLAFMFEQLFALLLFVVVKLDPVSSEILLLLVCLELADIVGVRKFGD
jgi:hypothetical protein